MEAYMYLYRAINSNDLNDLLNGKDIECSLSRSFKDQKKKSVETYYSLCLESERKFALDTVVGHIAGRRLNSGLSPWISTSKNLPLFAKNMLYLKVECTMNLIKENLLSLSIKRIF